MSTVNCFCSYERYCELLSEGQYPFTNANGNDQQWKQFIAYSLCLLTGAAPGSQLGEDCLRPLRNQPCPPNANEYVCISGTFSVTQNASGTTNTTLPASTIILTDTGTYDNIDPITLMQWRWGSVVGPVIGTGDNVSFDISPGGFNLPDGNHNVRLRVEFESGAVNAGIAFVITVLGGQVISFAPSVIAPITYSLTTYKTLKEVFDLYAPGGSIYYDENDNVITIPSDAIKTIGQCQLLDRPICYSPTVDINQIIEVESNTVLPNETIVIDDISTYDPNDLAVSVRWFNSTLGIEIGQNSPLTYNVGPGGANLAAGNYNLELRVIWESGEMGTFAIGDITVDVAQDVTVFNNSTPIIHPTYQTMIMTDLTRVYLAQDPTIYTDYNGDTVVVTTPVFVSEGVCPLSKEQPCCDVITKTYELIVSATETPPGALPQATVDLTNTTTYPVDDPLVTNQWRYFNRITNVWADLGFNTTETFNAAALANGTYETVLVSTLTSGWVISTSTAVLTVAGNQVTVITALTPRVYTYSVVTTMPFVRVYRYGIDSSYIDRLPDGSIYEPQGEVQFGDCCCESLAAPVIAEGYSGTVAGTSLAFVDFTFPASYEFRIVEFANYGTGKLRVVATHSDNSQTSRIVSYNSTTSTEIYKLLFDIKINEPAITALRVINQGNIDSSFTATSFDFNMQSLKEI